jgi:hypothetical protein
MTQQPWNSPIPDSQGSGKTDDYPQQKHIPYALAHSTMVLYVVHTHSDMLGRGLVLKGGLVTRYRS